MKPELNYRYCTKQFEDLLFIIYYLLYSRNVCKTSRVITMLKKVLEKRLEKPSEESQVEFITESLQELLTDCLE